MTIKERIEYYTYPQGEHLLWLGATNLEGYGQIKVGGQMRDVHRLAWVKDHGFIPKGLQVNHTCDIPPCIDPNHLGLGTPRDNMQDKVLAGHVPSTNQKKATTWHRQ